MFCKYLDIQRSIDRLIVWQAEAMQRFFIGLARGSLALHDTDLAHQLALVDCGVTTMHFVSVFISIFS